MKRMQKISLNFLTVSKKNKTKQNKKKTHLKYTLEKESNKFFSFLDILIKNERNRFPKLVYPKKASIRLLTQFNSFRIMSYKIGLVRRLIYRTFKSSS